jgi:hypothetical protein
MISCNQEVSGQVDPRQAFLTREALTEIARTTVANISALAGPTVVRRRFGSDLNLNGF